MTIPLDRSRAPLLGLPQLVAAFALLTVVACTATPSDQQPTNTPPAANTPQPTATAVAETQGPRAVTDALDAARRDAATTPGPRTVSTPAASRTTATPPPSATVVPSPAVDYFLIIEGIAGETTARGRQGAIAVDGWDHGGAREGGSGTTTNLAVPTDFFILKTVDASSPLLFRKLAKGDHIGQAVLIGHRISDGWEMLRVTLSDVLVSSYHVGGDLDGDGFPDEAVSFSFGKIEVEYTARKPDGTAGQTLKATWDVKANKTV